MDKKIIIAVGAVIIVAISLSLIFLGKKDQKSEAPQSTVGEQINGTMQELFNLGKNLKCETLTAEGQKISMYVYGKKIKVSLPMPDSEKSYMYTIYDGEYVYAWQTSQKEGTKFKIDPKEYFQPQPQEAVQEDYSKDLSYKCSAWVVDPHEFDLPEDISFQDMSSIMEEAQKATSDAQKKMCGTCATLKDEQKASCEEQFCSPE